MIATHTVSPRRDVESTPFLSEGVDKEEISPPCPPSSKEKVSSVAHRLQSYVVIAIVGSVMIVSVLLAYYQLRIVVTRSTCEDVQRVWWASFSQSIECTNVTDLVAQSNTTKSDGSASSIGTDGKGSQVHITTLPGILTDTIELGRIVLLFGPTLEDLSNTDVRTTTVKFFGKDVYNFSGQDVTFSGGSNDGVETGVFGWPFLTLDEIPSGTYFVKGFLNTYERVTRSDGSTIAVRFPCGDGDIPLGGPGSLTTNVLETHIHGGAQTIQLEFLAVNQPIEFDGSEIGGCSQGNYRDTELLKYVKIRSESLSNFWNRDMYVGAKVMLPFGYNASNKDTRYPVLFSQFHWLAGKGWWSNDPEFTDAWYSGIIPPQNGEPERPTPKLIVVMFRHENPFYDDSYAVNSANLGPYGDALNDELLPHLDQMFNTIPEPYARIQDGGSTGGWAAVASVVFRPDLYGACFASYPDSLDFHKHQDNNLYEQSNVHVRNGLEVPSNRKIGDDGVPYVRVTMAQENHWELAFANSGRSSLQTDVWFAVYGVQGLNGYPLGAWDKVTGEIYPDVVQMWKPMDLTDYITSNWNGKLNLGEVLRRRLFIYVGGTDSYYLDEGVEQFRVRVTEKGGPDWANVTAFPGEPHGGVYNLLPLWTYVEMILDWIHDHAPDGRTPLPAEHTTSASRGNLWKDVSAFGGYAAALARQSPPYVHTVSSEENNRSVQFHAEASVGRWDPGVKLEARWLVDGKGDDSERMTVRQGQMIEFSGLRSGNTLQLEVTGTKRDYTPQTRRSNVLVLG